MGVFDKLLSSMRGGSRRLCPDCGERLWADSGGRYECHNDDCTGWRVYFDEDGGLVDPSNRGNSGRFDGPCEVCQASLSGGTSYLPYEDGSNPHAYIVCPSCGHQNIFYGFGGED